MNLNDAPLTVAPNYAGVAVETTEGSTPQDRETAGWGAWPQSMVTFQDQTGLSSYFYSSGSGEDAKKPPLPFVVDFKGPTATPTPPVTTPASPSAPTPTPTTTPAPVAPSGPEAGAPVFTQPPAQLGSRSLSFTGLPGISVVTVPLADGSRTTVLKLTADSITIQGFSLTVRKQTGPSLATTADTMTLKGHVQVYLDSITATDANGHSYTLGADTPPPNDGLPPQLLRVTLGLVGATADSIVYTNTKQHLSE